MVLLLITLDTAGADNLHTYSVACANGMPINVGLRVSVYISIPVPRK